MMKICSRCGYQNTDNSGYCEKCGQQLLQQPDRSVQNRMDYGQQEQNPMHYEQQGAQGQRQRGNGQRNIAWNQSGQTIEPPKKKKKTGLIIAIVILVAAILLLVAAFLFRDKIKEVISEHFPSIVTEQQEPEKKQAKTEQDDKKKETVEADAQPETDDAETQTVSDVQPDAQINAVDNVYVSVSGLIQQREGDYALSFSEPVTVAAYAEDGAEKTLETSELYFDGWDEVGDYLGAEVTVKGKLVITVEDKVRLQVVDVTVTKEAPKEDTNYASHTYKLVIDDVSWTQAQANCISRGGYLAQINSADEYNEIVRLIDEANVQDVYFYLGGSRSTDGTDYYWINTENEFVGAALNPGGDSWAADYWMENEPSYSAGGEPELYMNLLSSDGVWLLNDIPENISAYYPGKTGYICEIDDADNLVSSGTVESTSTNDGMMSEDEIYSKLVEHYKKGTEDCPGDGMTVMEGGFDTETLYTTSVRCGVPGNEDATQRLYDISVNAETGEVTQIGIIDEKVTVYNL